MCELIELSKETIASCEPVLETIITHRVQGHPHVIKLFGYFIEPPYFGIVTELCRDTVKTFVVPTLENAEQELGWRLGVALQAASAIEYLHKQVPPIIHRDIKWGNYLIAENNGQIKLCDFGEAIEYS